MTKTVGIIMILILLFAGSIGSATTVKADSPTNFLWDWGNNSYGQLGNGMITGISTTPVQVSNLIGATSVATGFFTLVLKLDGTVWAWGANGYGQLGNGTTLSSVTPVQVNGLSGVIAIAVGQSHSLALKSDGTVWAWGLNMMGQLGTGGNYMNITSPVQVSGLSGVIAISAGSVFSLAVKSDGTAWAWGYNTDGELGNGMTSLYPSTTPVQVSGLSGVTAVAGGWYHSMALKSDGTVWAWGSNSYGQLGNGTSTNSDIPVQVSGLSCLTAIAAGAYHNVALKSDGTVWSWGSNAYGQLGDGNTNNSTIPVQVSGLSGVTAIAGGGYEGMALKSDKTVWDWGNNASGQLGNGTTANSSIPVQVSGLNGVNAINTGNSGGMAITQDGIVWSWGGNLGNGSPSGGIIPVSVNDLSGITAIAGGCLALKSDGTVWTWGYNVYGEFGNGTTSNSSTPIQVSGLSGVVAVAAGLYHNMALKSDGTVWTWGYNLDGQLGNGTTTSSSIPIEVSGLTGITAIAGAGYTSLALKSDGTVWAWGNNSYGELGNGTTTQSRIPVEVSGLGGVAAIAGGDFYHCLALKSDGTVWAWGYNADGELGNGSTANSSIPIQVSGLSGVNTIAAGKYHSMASKSDGTVWTWGNNSYGQLGNGTTTNGSLPVAVIGLSGVAAVAAGDYHSVALKSDGTVWSWGFNQYGQLGTGGTTNSSTPIQVSGLSGVTSISAGGYDSLAIKSTTSQFSNIVITSSANPSTAGQSITLTVKVTAVAPATGTPTGHVIFLDGVATLGTGTLDNSGQSTYTTTILLAGSNNITAVYTGDDSFAGSMSDLFQIVNDATLNNLTISSGILTPSFASGTTTYSDSLDSSVSSITVTPTANQINSTVTVNGTPVASGLPSQSISMGEGTNIIAIEVTAGDGVTKITYTITVIITTETTIENGETSVSQSNGVSVDITGSTASDGTAVTISSTNYGSVQPSGTGAIQLAGSLQYYDVNVSDISGLGSDAIAEVSINSPSVTSDSTIQYWYNGVWNTANNISINGTTITGDIPVTALGGTPIVIGKLLPSTTSGTNATATFSNNTQTVNLTATVSSTGGTVNEGAVIFTVKNGTTVIGTSVTSGTVKSGSANVNYTLPGNTPTGTYTILAAYSGGAHFSSSSNNTANLIVNPAGTTVAGDNKTASFSSSTQTVNLTATVSSTRGIVNEGTVTFTLKSGNTIIGSPVNSVTVNAGNASANYTLPGNTPTGTCTLLAAYSGGPDFNASSDNTANLIVKKADQTFIISFPNPSISGSQVIFAALVVPSTLNPVNLITIVNGLPVLNTGALAAITSGNLPTGNVTFFNGTSPLGTITLNKFGFATFTISSLAVGNNSITAQYSGDGNYFTSVSSAVNQVVQNNTSTVLTSSMKTSVFGQTILFTATVTPNGATGTITFKDGDKTLGVVPLSAGTSTFTASSLTVGSHSITAVFSGDSNNSGSTSNVVNQVINKLNTTIGLSSSSNPGSSKNPVTFTVTVSPGLATGTVTFKNGNVTLGTATLSNGQASLSIKLSAGSYSILAVYNGDSNFNSSVSNTLSQIIKK